MKSGINPTALRNGAILITATWAIIALVVAAIVAIVILFG